MKLATCIFTTSALTLGGCLSISTGCGESRREPPQTVHVITPGHVVTTRPAWPPAHISLDPNAIYVTGIGRYQADGRSEALQNALEQARRMGLKDPVLSEVCDDPNPSQGTRILYRVVNVPAANPTK